MVKSSAEIILRTIKVYNKYRMFDLSSMPFFDFGEEFTEYQTEVKAAKYDPDSINFGTNEDPFGCQTGQPLFEY